MRLTADDVTAYGASVALLAVHSSISLNDAIMVGTTGKRSKSEDHRRAAVELEKLCKTVNVKDKKGIQHLIWLLSRKTDVAYGTERLDSVLLLAARDRAERFQVWAYNNFKGVLRASSET